MNKRINIRPTTSVYATYKNIKYDPWTAIAEFVDNSTQSYYDNVERLKAIKYWDGLEVAIIYERNANGDKLVIRDNAYGMDFNDFQRAIVLDSPPPKKTRSEFGMGLKTAACWFGKNWRVESTALGSGVKYSASIDVEALHKYKNEEIEVEEEAVSTKEHGTVITIWNMNRTIVGRQVGKTKDQLRGMYRVDLRSKEIRITYNGEELVYEEPPVLVEKLPDGSMKQWRKDISFEIPYMDEMLHVSGFVGIREKASTAAAGFALLRRGRVIVGGYENAYRPEEIFGSTTTYVYQRLFGELNMDDWPVSQTKDAFDWYNGLEDALIEQLNICCDDYKNKAKDYRVGKRADFGNTTSGMVDRFTEAGVISDASVDSFDVDDEEAKNTHYSDSTEEQNVNERTSEYGDNSISDKVDEKTDKELLIDGALGQTISFKTTYGEYKFNIRLKKSDPLQSWLVITKENDKENEFNISWNVRHPFFKPYIDEPEFLGVMEQFIFALALAEIESSRISIDGKIEAHALRMRMNELLKDVARGGNKNE